MKRLSVVLFVMLITGLLPVLAQYRTPPSKSGIGIMTPNLLSASNQLSGLLDVSKLHMSHQFSTGFSSGGSGNTLSALYMNSMTYQVSSKFQWIGAFGYGGTALNSLPNGQTGGMPLGMVGFLWQPKKNFWISASVGRNVISSDSYMSPFWGYDRGWGSMPVEGR